MATGVRQGARWRPTSLALAAALAWLGLALVPSAARATAVADAGCDPPTDGAYFANGDRREAQTFTARHSGTLTRAQVLVDNPPSEPNDFVLQILATDGNGTPLDPPLSSAGVPNASVQLGTALLDASFSSPARVVAGHRYAIAVGRPGTATLFSVRTRSGDPCGGTPFFNTGPGWSPESNPSVDVVFQTYVDPAGGGPNNDFSLVNKRGRLFAKVPGPGKLVVDDAPRVPRAARAEASRKRNFIKRTKARARKAGLVRLRVLLSKRGIRHFFRTGKLKTRAGVTYTPTGGFPNTLTFKINIRL